MAVRPTGASLHGPGRKIRVAAEAGNQTASGLLQGAGWAVGAGAIGLIALHPVIVAGAVVASGATLAGKKVAGAESFGRRRRQLLRGGAGAPGRHKAVPRM